MVYYQNALQIVSALNKGKTLDIDTNQSNRHCILLNQFEKKVAYYFSVPIYQIDSGKLIRRRFEEKQESYVMYGSNCIITVEGSVVSFQNKDGILRLSIFPMTNFKLKNGCLYSDRLSLIPTFNGILLKGDLGRFAFEYAFSFEVQQVRSNTTCVAFMQSKFRPYFVLSTLFSGTKRAEVIDLNMKRKTEKNGTFRFAFTSKEQDAMAELNLYEHKLIQDTPVSSLRPTENNAYGSMAFLGNSLSFGTQWLYSRIDLQKISELKSKEIESIGLYIPKGTPGFFDFDVYALSNRFCSFGSNWQNKTLTGSFKSQCLDLGEHLFVDLSGFYMKRHRIEDCDGFVLKGRNVEKERFLPISTGDTSTAPQILCVHYRK